MIPTPKVDVEVVDRYGTRSKVTGVIRRFFTVFDAEQAVKADETLELIHWTIRTVTTTTAPEVRKIHELLPAPQHVRGDQRGKK